MGITCSSLGCCLPHRKQESPSQIPSSETPAFLPNDVIFDILCRIPVKALCRLRCVSREWCALISSPEFVAVHKSRRPAELLIVATSYREKSLKLIDMDGCLVRVINGTGMYWRPVCTGAHDVLFATSYSEHVGYLAGVIDLATMMVIAVRPKRNISYNKGWGIGRAVPSGACKVLRFTTRHSEVFTVGDGAGWRQRQSPPSFNYYYDLKGETTAVNGMLYFLAETQPNGDLRVLCFDLEREEWKDTIKGPPNVKIDPRQISTPSVYFYFAF